MALIELDRVTKRFGGLVANREVSFRLEEPCLVGLIGPNGAGKTTLFNCIAGFFPPTEGRIIFRGQDITHRRDYEVARLGLARTFQIFQASGDLKVVENVMVGAFLQTSSRRAARAKALEALEFLGIGDSAPALMTELPVAAQKRVALATALASDPVLILLDEVGAGLNRSEIEGLVGLLRKIHQERGVSLLLTEHVLEMVMALSHRVLVLESGQLIADGRPEEVVQNPEVIRAYLGDHFVKRTGDGAAPAGEGAQDA
ncbi:MAG: ABC transporter ATP-binding protein [Deltaproteobacteria bacterium]|nr:ABC transporter ATP-binding protein [Deltaproteobacteria bacterium]